MKLQSSYNSSLIEENDLLQKKLDSSNYCLFVDDENYLSNISELIIKQKRLLSLFFFKRTF